MPHLTNLPPNPPEEFSMLNEIFELVLCQDLAQVKMRNLSSS